MDSPVSQPEQFEDHDIHRGTSPTPTLETSTPAATTLPAPTTSPPAPQQTTAAGIRDARANPNEMSAVGQRKAQGQADASSPKRHDQPEPPAPIPHRGRSRRGCR